ncbi:MAG: hypothetical protein KIT56_08255 [Gammaproteobacteria bacterium]|nr:hypothetical protein [Gammaproteobacteria bacterium]MCW5583851.1 hypothetical protein [Gammaproteobacteria bacterium]
MSKSRLSDQAFERVYDQLKTCKTQDAVSKFFVTNLANHEIDDIIEFFNYVLTKHSDMDTQGIRGNNNVARLYKAIVNHIVANDKAIHLFYAEVDKNDKVSFPESNKNILSNPHVMKMHGYLAEYYKIHNDPSKSNMTVDHLASGIHIKLNDDTKLIPFFSNMPLYRQIQDTLAGSTTTKTQGIYFDDIKKSLNAALVAAEEKKKKTIDVTKEKGKLDTIISAIKENQKQAMDTIDSIISKLQSQNETQDEIDYYTALRIVLAATEPNLTSLSKAIDNIYIMIMLNDDVDENTDPRWISYKEILKALGVTQDQIDELTEMRNSAINDETPKKKEKKSEMKEVKDQPRTPSMSTLSSSGNITASNQAHSDVASGSQTAKSQCAPKQYWRFIDYDKPKLGERAKNAAIKLTRPPIDYSIMEGDEKTPVLGGGISILGAHLNRETLDELKRKYPGKEIVDMSILNIFELTSVTGITPLTPKELEAAGIIQELYPMLDNAGPKNRDGMHPGNILAAARAIDEHLKKGRLVYCHCKSGKGRSVMVEVTYLALYSAQEPMASMRIDKKPTYEILKAAIAFARQQRPGIDLHEEYINDLSNSDNGRLGEWAKLAGEKYEKGSSNPNSPYGLEDSIVENEKSKKKGILSKALKEAPNIGKIILAHDAMLLEQTERTQGAKPAEDYSYTGKHFWHNLTQSFAYRNLIMYFVLVDKHFIPRSDLLKAKEAFCTLLKDHPAEAIRQLKEHFEGGAKADSKNLISEMVMAAKHEKCLTLGITVTGKQDYDIRELLANVYNGIKQYDYTYQSQLRQIPASQGVSNQLGVLQAVLDQHKGDTSDKYLLLSQYIKLIETEAKNSHLTESQLIKNLTAACDAVKTYKENIKQGANPVTTREQLSQSLKSYGIIGELLDNSKVIGGKYLTIGANYDQWDAMVPKILILETAIATQITQAQKQVSLLQQRQLLQRPRLSYHQWHKKHLHPPLHGNAFRNHLSRLLHHLENDNRTGLYLLPTPIYPRRHHRHRSEGHLSLHRRVLQHHHRILLVRTHYLLVRQDRKRVNYTTLTRVHSQQVLKTAYQN